MTSSFQGFYLFAFQAVTPISDQYNVETKTLSFTLNFTNPGGVAQTCNALSVNLSDNQTGYPLGQLCLPCAMQLEPSETRLITLTDTLSQGAANDVATTYAGEQSMNVTFSNVSVTIKGMTMQISSALPSLNIPIEAPK
jgi:hypothetical protein